MTDLHTASLPANVEGSTLAVTLDVDWAPDFAIDYVASRFEAAGVRATWFATHASPAMDRVRSRSDLFETGIHPNFLPGSTHGGSESEVLRHCMAFAPNALSVRTHGLVQTSNLLEKFVTETPVRTDVSLFLPHAPNLQPVTYYWPSGKSMLRMPYFWEDDFEMVRPEPCWHMEPYLALGTGLKIFGFHPMHVYLNSVTLDAYRRAVQERRLSELRAEDVDGLVNRGDGVRTLFDRLLQCFSGRPSYTVADLTCALGFR